MTQLERIFAMEAAFDRAHAALAANHLDAPEFPLLAAYLDDGDWLRDYTADEQGRIPKGMKRGVLSQDGLYNLVTDWEASK